MMNHSYTAFVPDLPETTIIRRRQLGEHLRSTRHDLGLTQAMIAHVSGIDRSFYVEVETSKRSLTLDRLFAIADALQVTAAELLRGID